MTEAQNIQEVTDPIELFLSWMVKAEAAEPNNPNAVCLATADSKGRPSARMVLLKGVDDKGFVFYTNTESRKGEHLAENPAAALCFYWKSLGKQVRVEGHIESVTAKEADEYYDTRPRGSRIGAWASRQSRPLPARADLEEAVRNYEAKFGESDPIPRPSYWSGYRLIPERIEFWTEELFRLHRRVEYLRKGKSWTRRMLYP